MRYQAKTDPLLSVLYRTDKNYLSYICQIEFVYILYHYVRMRYFIKVLSLLSKVQTYIHTHEYIQISRENRVLVGVEIYSDGYLSYIATIRRGVDTTWIYRRFDHLLHLFCHPILFWYCR